MAVLALHHQPAVVQHRHHGHRAGMQHELAGRGAAVRQPHRVAHDVQEAALQQLLARDRVLDQVLVVGHR
jgi:hypothetical protein